MSGSVRPPATSPWTCSSSWRLARRAASSKPRPSSEGDGCALVARYVRAKRYPGIALSRSTYVSPPPPGWGSTWRTERSGSCIRLEDDRQRSLEREAVRVEAEPVERRAAKLRAGTMDAHDGRGELVRVRRSCDRAVHAFLDQFGRCIVRSL